MAAVWIPLAPAFPSPASDDEMVHNDNYEMIMPDDHQPAQSMHYQNFDEFYNAEKAANEAMDNMEMDDSRVSMVMAPLPPSIRERQLREHLEELDVQRERRVQRSLFKGATQPLSNVNDWEKFDYDMLLNDV